MTQKMESRSGIRFATSHYGFAGLGLVSSAVKHILGHAFFVHIPLPPRKLHPLSR